MKKAKVIIIGGGIIGTSVAYYLARTKVEDVYLIEKENLLGTGITQYCSGGIRSQFTTLVNILFSIESLKELGLYDYHLKREATEKKLVEDYLTELA